MDRRRPKRCGRRQGCNCRRTAPVPGSLQDLDQGHLSAPSCCSGLRMFLWKTPAGGPLSPWKMVRYKHTCYSLSGFVNFKQTILKTVSTNLTYSKMFEINYWTAFLTARHKGIAKYLQAPSFLNCKNIKNCLWHVRSARIIFQYLQPGGL